MNNIINIINNSLIDLPTPTAISFLWNIGFLLGATLILQITTGLFLSISYAPATETVFNNIIILIRDLDTGWATRNIHSNGASLFFALIYIHISRGIYFTSPNNNPNVWTSGVIILLCTIATAFLGYVLPWGQISFWGATVITGVLTAIPLLGNELVIWLWGGPSVAQPTLNRFFSLHFLIPILIAALVIIHLFLLHENGSSNPTNTQTNIDNIKFHPYFTTNDLVPAILLTITILILTSNNPNLLGDVENFNPANPLVAPLHIQPEWYFLFAYVILRSIPSKLGGVIAMLSSILVLIIIINNQITTNFSPPNNINLMIFISTTIILTWIGTNSVEAPFESIGNLYTMFYFFLALLI